jgi:hypothetical protein
MKIHISGTVVASRKDVPSDLKMKKLQEYELCAYQCDVKMMCLSFHDKRLVTMQSALFGPQTELIAGYRKKSPVQFKKTTAILEYTKCMGGVDRDLQGGPTNGGKNYSSVRWKSELQTATFFTH